MNRLFIISAEEQQYKQKIANENLPRLEIVDIIEDANIILAEPPLLGARVNQASKLEWLQSTFAGCDALLAEKKQDYQLSNVRGVFGPLMSEYIFGYLISRLRHFDFYNKMQQQKSWSPKTYQSLAGKTMLILGTGYIGQHIASTAKHFGMQTLGISSSGDKAPHFDHVKPVAYLPQALARTEIIVSVLPSTARTINLFNKKIFSYCNNALFFNLGRGSLLVEKDLLWAIDNQHIAHAYLDVFHQEPMQDAHPFWHNSAITITPHIAAKSFADSVFGIFVENYQRFLAKQPLNFVIDFKKGY